MWVLEGLTMYLDGDSVARLVTALAGLSAPGSRMVVTLVGEHSVQRARASAAAGAARASWKWGTDHPEEFFASHG